MEIRLTSKLDLSGLAEAFQSESRLKVRDVFLRDSAERVFSELQRLPWGFVYNDGGKLVQLDADAVARLRRDQLEDIRNGIVQRAASQYQFAYGRFPLCELYLNSDRRAIPLFALYEFLNSPDFLDFARTVTGLHSIRSADAQATLFGPGHFIMGHTDRSETDRRLAAYVLNFTKDWNVNWGGYLQFFDEGGDVVEAYRPEFNSLTIFKVPTAHSVSMVTPFAGSRRYAISGWLREEELPQDLLSLDRGSKRG